MVSLVAMEKEKRKILNPFLLKLMRLVNSTFSLIILVVTVLACTVLFFHVLTLVPAPGSSSETILQDEEDTSLLSWILSKLSLVPNSQKERELVAFMIENHELAREHHRGLRSALFIEEFLVEGYISRFAVIFDRKKLPNSIGPIRSLRPYFIDAMIPWVTFVFHAGGSPEALDRVGKGTGVTSINGLALDDLNHRDDSIPAPHNFFFSRDQVSEFMPKKHRTTLWPPYKVGALSSSHEDSLPENRAKSISINFFSPFHDVMYSFDTWARTYKRTNGETVSDARPSNVLIVEMPITEEGEFGRLTIPVEGQGKALLFCYGIVQKGRWIKSGRQNSFRFEDKEGNLFSFAGGQTWMTVVPTLQRVSWE
jgi:hypothetical protein